MTNQTQNKSFILHNDSLEILDKLSDEQAGKLFKAIKFYQKHKQLPQLDFTLDLVFTPFLNQFKRDEEKYQNIVERNKINGSKGGRPKNPVGYLETQQNPTKPKKAYSDSKNKNDSKNDSDNKNKNNNNQFIPPTLQQVKDYCLEKGYVLDCQKFIDYYTASNWKDKDNKQVKNWKQKVITWLGRDKTSLTLPSNVIEINKLIGDIAVKEIKEYHLEVDFVCFPDGAKKVRSLDEQQRQIIRDQFNNRKINLV